MTDDGYILSVYRIPGKLQGTEEPGPPVLLMHGIESDMMQWVFNAPDVAPALVLARAGYDVWLGNNRGTRWSEAHQTLSSKDEAFWDWSWEEMGTHDTPALIKHILTTTGNEKLSYIGHSEGTSQIMSGASLNPLFYKEKLNVAIFLAPPAALKNCQVVLFQLMSQEITRNFLVSMG